MPNSGRCRGRPIFGTLIKKCMVVFVTSWGLITYALLWMFSLDASVLFCVQRGN